MIRMSAVVFFSDKSSREDSLNMSYEESHSGQDNFLYDCIRHFNLFLMLCCKLHAVTCDFHII